MLRTIPPPRRVLGAVVARARATPTVLVIGMLLVMAHVLLRTWALDGSWFFADDLALMSRAMSQPLDASYLLEPYAGHLIPAGLAATWGLTQVALYEWAPWAATLLGLQALLGVGMLRLLRSLFGDSRVVLALLALYLTYVFTLTSGVWFAAGIRQLPLQVALVFGLHSLLAYLRTARWRHLLPLVLWTGVGLAFSEKTLLLLAVYAIVALCWFADGSLIDRVRILWRRYRPGGVLLVLLGAAYVVAYAVYALGSGASDVADRELVPLVVNVLAVAGPTGVVGGPLRWHARDGGVFADPAQVLMLVSWLAVAGVGWYAHTTRTASLRAWLPLAFTVLADVVLLTSAPTDVDGADIGLLYAGQAETGVLFVIGLGLAFLPLRGAIVQNVAREDADLRFESGAAVGFLAAAVALTGTLSTVGFVKMWQDQNHTAAYYAAVKRSLADAPERPVPLVDAPLPQRLLPAGRRPENTYSRVFANLGAETRYPREATDQIYLLDGEGRLTYATIAAQRSMVPGANCGYPLSGTATGVPLDGAILGPDWWVQLSTISKQATSVTVTAGDEVHEMDIPAGVHKSFLTASGRFRSVRLSGYDVEAGTCVLGLVVGVPEPGLAVG